MKRIVILLVGGLALLSFAACQPAVEEQGEPTPTDSVLSNVPSIAEVAGTAVPTIPPLPTLDPGEVALGQQVYAEHCASCHGANLEGEPDWKTQNEDQTFRAPPHNADGHTWHHADALLIETIEQGGARLPDNIGGTSEMPAFGEILTAAEITAVLTYIKSTWPLDIRTTQWQVTARSQP